MSLTPLDLQAHLNDADWLEDHFDQVYAQISRGLEYGPSALETIVVLNLIMPYALTRADYKRWETPLYNALLCAMSMKNTEAQIQLWSHLGACLFRSGRYQNASDAFQNALVRTDHHATPENRLLARIGILHTKSMVIAPDIDQFIKETLTIARAIADDRLLGQLHYTLAVVYTHQAETSRALGHGQVALAYWYRLVQRDQQQCTILLLAEACRVAQRLPHAAHFLEQAQPGATSTYQAALYQYLQGSMHLDNDQPEDAARCYQDALTHFIRLDFPYMTAAACHGLALAETRLLDFDSARHHLRQALITWQKMGIDFQQASGVYALGHLEATAQNYPAARALYLQALQLVDQLPESPIVAGLRAEIQQELAGLPA